MTLGRPRGSKDKTPRATAARKAAFASLAFAERKGVMSPLDVMLEDMQAKYRKGDIAAAADRATDCAPYVHARLASATITHLSVWEQMTLAQLEQLATALALHNGNDLAPSRPLSNDIKALAPAVIDDIVTDPV